MSIFGTSLMFPDDGETECKAPIRYRNSSVLPSNNDERCGSLDLGYIPGHISRPERPKVGDDFHPWLRVSVSDGRSDATVLLDYDQVVALHKELAHWIQRAHA